MRYAATLLLVLMLSCAPEDEEGTRLTGEPCGWSLQCEGGICIADELAGEETGWTDGMCSRACGDGQCPEGELCTDLGDGRYCLPACQEAGAEPCREGYICHSVLKVCHPECATCPEGLVCADSGECEQESGRILGEACEADMECETGLCLEAVENGMATPWIGGICSAPCSPGMECPAGTGCMPMPGHGVCLTVCSGPPLEAGCRLGYVCDPGRGLCLPSCSSGWPCAPGQACSDLGVCVNVQPQGN